MVGEEVRKLKHDVQQAFYDDFTLFGLRSFIVFWALLIIILAFMINNKWILAGIIAYEVLP